MSRKSRLAEFTTLVDGAKGVAPARDEVSRRAYDEVRSSILSQQRDEAAAGRKVKKALRLIDSGKPADGVKLAVSAMDDDPDCVPAYMVAGAGLDQLGLLLPALTVMEEALRIAPTNPLIPSVLADIAKRNGDLESAEQLIRLASQIDPLNWRNAASLALILRDKAQYDEAIDLLRGQILIYPEEPLLWNALAAVLVDYGDVDHAKIFAREAIRLRPNNLEAVHNLGVALLDEGDFEGAYDCFVRSATVKAGLSQRANGGLSLAHTLLGLGRLGEGWPAYEVRVEPGVGLLDFITEKPRWTGDDLAGKRLLLIGEQGLGDEIMFMAILPEAQAAVGPAGSVGVACEARLVDLFARSFGVEVLPHGTGRHNGRTVRGVPNLDWSNYDCWAPMGDLARYFRPTIDAFGATRPFLKPDPARVADFKAQRDALAPGMAVGIAWRSLLMTAQRQRYFADIEDWAPVLTTPGVTFFSLQPGDIAEEEARLAARFGVTIQKFEGLDVKADLDGIAAASAALDLVIAPMNASSNLAAGLGMPVWFTAGHKDWSMLGTNTIPWYPWTRLFLASRQSAWGDLYSRVGEELAAFAASR
ncbi:MAG: tetratricopeptide repeat protein [Alphaproteobacteria bacterium]|nr:tetratricopeptide repeat protein [Alphaproteobacteria bacterium]